MEASALAVARRALEIGPRDLRLCLVLALLQARYPPNSRAAESLNISHLIDPNRAELISIRLAIVTSKNALSDSNF
jgi:hypothetical protein